MRRMSLEYPEIVKSNLRIYDFDSGKSIEGKQPIEKPESMGIDKIVEAVFKNYNGRLEIENNYFSQVKRVAEEVLLEFENNQQVIQDRQLTMEYFFENDALRHFINTKEAPADIWSFSHDIIQHPQKALFNFLKNKRVFRDYIKGLENIIVDPPSEVMRNLKKFLQDLIKNRLSALEDQISEVEDYTITLKIPNNKILKQSINPTAQNSKDDVLKLKKVSVDQRKLIEVYLGSLLEHANKEGEKFDDLEITITKGQNVKIETLSNRIFQKPKRKEILKEGDFPVKKELLEHLVGSLVIELDKRKSDEEQFLYSEITNRFPFFWANLKYYAHMADYFHDLKKQGYPLSMPNRAPEEECVIKVDEGYSFNLIRNMPKKEIVPNDINIGENGSHIYLITGPNTNGKTTFLNMVAGFLAAYQAGWYLPSKSAKISPRKGIKSFYTQIVSEDDAESRFSRDMVRTRQIFQRIEDYDIVPMDEPITSTNTESIQNYLQRIVKDTLPHAPKVLFVITSHEHSLIDIVEKLPKAENLKCHVIEDGDKIIRTKKIIPGYSTISNAEDLMEEIGADPDSLVEYMKKSAEEGKLTLV